MTLDPLKRDRWTGMTDLLRPPAGYHLDAALLTTFGMSFEALLAAILSMQDAEDLVESPDTLSRVIAATRAASSVRVLTQAGNLTAPLNALPKELSALLEGMIVPIKPRAGVFHPKLWLVLFAPNGVKRYGKGDDWVVRAVVSSRNLTASDNLELGLALTGGPATRRDLLATDLQAIVADCARLGGPPMRQLARKLDKALSRSRFDETPQTTQSVRAIWQTSSGHRVLDAVSNACEEIVALSPFLTDTMVQELIQRSKALTLVSNPTELSKLSEVTLHLAAAQSDKQGHPVLLAFKGGVADAADDDGPDDTSADGSIDGLHAKALFIRDAQGGTQTLVGSANATNNGLGTASSRNVECVAVTRPGVVPAAAREQFIEEKKGTYKPWIEPFSADQRRDVTEEEEHERALQGAVQQLAALPFEMRYERDYQRLSIGLAEGVTLPPVPNGSVSECLPFALYEHAAIEETSAPWQPLSRLASGSIRFENVPLAVVSRFIVVRITSSDGRPRVRLACATLQFVGVSEKARDLAAREALLLSVDPADVLDRLVAGLSFVGRPSSRPTSGHRRSGTLINGRSKPPQTSLEQLLRAAVAHPHIVRELTLLLGHALDDEGRRFIRDLASVTADIA